MPRLNFTNRTLEALKPKKDRVDYFDKSLPGFCLRVTPAGVKSFGCLYYVDKRKVRYTLGTFPPLTLFSARTEAKRILGKAQLGDDPAAEKFAKREAGTFGELAEDYIKGHVEPEKGLKTHTQIEYQRQIAAYLLPKWKHKKASAIIIDDVDALLDGMKKTPVQANRTRSLLRHMFRWALAKPSRRRKFALTANPVADVEKPAPEKPRERVYSDDEPKTALIREAFVRRADSTLPNCVRDAIEKGGFTLPRRATFADGMAAVIFASALKGNPAAARLVHEICEGQRVVISDEGGAGPGAVAAALDKIRAL